MAFKFIYHFSFWEHYGLNIFFLSSSNWFLKLIENLSQLERFHSFYLSCLWTDFLANSLPLDSCKSKKYCQDSSYQNILALLHLVLAIK